jgi:hypothetical protein
MSDDDFNSWIDEELKISSERNAKLVKLCQFVNENKKQKTKLLELREMVNTLGKANGEQGVIIAGLQRNLEQTEASLVAMTEKVKNCELESRKHDEVLGSAFSQVHAYMAKLYDSEMRCRQLRRMSEAESCRANESSRHCVLMRLTSSMPVISG